MKHICIANDFSISPSGREPDDGPFNGQRFREELLVPALQTNEKVSVRIDEVEGYGSSFLEEAFGGLVRQDGFTAKQLEQKLELVADKQKFKIYTDVIWYHIRSARPEKKDAY
ncbi:MAG: STAS-like domain-containing protein [Verrucomicrobiota bacterium]